MMWPYILIGIVVVIAALCIVIARRPSDFKVSRSATMAAPASAVFAQVNDFHNWEAWSPWAKLDPNAKNTFDGPPSGTGTKFGWSGDNKVGEGKMEIVESRPYELVRIKLDFIRPFAGTNDVAFVIKQQGDQTNITWSMSGKTNFVMKAVGLFMDCEKMVGEQYEQGLANLKGIAEGAAKPVTVS